MPLQNRVAPDGQIHANPARGTLMGNRGGRIHSEGRTLSTARWRSRQWISCLLNFKGRHRAVMGQSYTELFFLDEVTALAAGHRPCFECRRAAAVDFAQRFPGEGRSRAPEMDRILHAARLAPKDQGLLSDQPDGTMGTDGTLSFVKYSGRVLTWSFGGYQVAPAPSGPVLLLTPPPIREVLGKGYEPLWHPSADGCE